MISNLNSLKQKVEKLTYTYIYEGVQPNDLIYNIYNDFYKQITVSKENNLIVLNLRFIDESEVNMEYVYDDKELIEVREISNNKKLILWNKQSELKNLLQEIIVDIYKIGNKNKVEDILKTLPPDLYSTLKLHYEKIS